MLQKLLQGIILLPLLLAVFSFLFVLFFFFFWWQHHTTIYRLLFATKSEHSSTSLPSPCLISSQHRLNYRMLLSYSNCFQKQRFLVIQPKQLPLQYTYKPLHTFLIYSAGPSQHGLLLCPRSQSSGSNGSQIQRQKKQEFVLT